MMATTPTLGDKPIEQHYRETMQAIASALDGVLNEGKSGKDRETGFVLMVYPFGNLAAGDARCNYISNGADRKDVVALMKEMIARSAPRTNIACCRWAWRSAPRCSVSPFSPATYSR